MTISSVRLPAKMDETKFKARIEQIFGDLDRYNYYELLNLPEDAAVDDIRSAFHRMALSMHPDRYQGHPDTTLRKKLYTIYKRMTEGYKILMNSQDRKEYNQGLPQGQMRLNRVERRNLGPKPKADNIHNPQAKKFFTLGQQAEHQGDLKGAKLNYTFALNLVGKHPLIEEHIAHIKALEKDK